MNNSKFKNIFNEIAMVNGFEESFGGWFKESSECIAALELQKSNFGNFYQLNIKIYIQGLFGERYTISENLIKEEVGHIRNGESQEYRRVFDLDESIDDNDRKEKLKILFAEYIGPFVQKALSKAGIKSLIKTREILLLPAIADEFGKLS